MKKVKEEKKDKEIEIVNDKVVSLDRINTESETGIVRKYKVLTLREVK